MKTLVFLGTPPMAAELLKKIIDGLAVEVIGVVTKPDKPLGRRRIMTPSPVAVVAEKYGIPIHKPIRLNKDYDFIAEKNPDLLLTFAYGQLISDQVLGLSKYQALNLHGSLLPKYRGAAPLQYALHNGDKKTGISLMAMINKMDAGAVYGTAVVDIDDDDNYSSLSQKMVVAAFTVLSTCLEDFWDGKIIPTVQDESAVTFCPSLKPEDEHLDLTKGKIDFVNQIRSLSEIPGGYLLSDDGEQFKIYRAHIINDLFVAPIGTITLAAKKELILQLKDGQIALDIVQKAGKNKMDAASFNNGNRIEGQIFK